MPIRHHQSHVEVPAAGKPLRASDRPPAALSGLGPELVGRVAGGLVCGVEAAEFTTRYEIAKRSGVDASQLCRFVHGEGRLTTDSLDKIGAVLGLRFVIEE